MQIEISDSLWATLIELRDPNESKFGLDISNETAYIEALLKIARGLIVLSNHNWDTYGPRNIAPNLARNLPKHSLSTLSIVKSNRREGEYEGEREDSANISGTNSIHKSPHELKSEIGALKGRYSDAELIDDAIGVAAARNATRRITLSALASWLRELERFCPEAVEHGARALIGKVGGFTGSARGVWNYWLAVARSAEKERPWLKAQGLRPEAAPRVDEPYRAPTSQELFQRRAAQEAAESTQRQNRARAIADWKKTIDEAVRGLSVEDRERIKTEAREKNQIAERLTRHKATPAQKKALWYSVAGPFLGIPEPKEE